MSARREKVTYVICKVAPKETVKIGLLEERFVTFFFVVPSLEPAIE